MKIKLGLLALCLCASAAFSQENYSTWSNSQFVNINTTSANLGGPVTNVPILVRLTPANATIFSQAAAAGADVRFTDSTGTTRLKHQTLRYNSTADSAEFWVLLPGVAATGTTKFKMYWGKSGAADSSNGASVFDTTTAGGGFKAVWHLNDVSNATAVDAAGSGYNGIASTTAPAVATGAPLPGGRVFDGTSTYYYMPTPTSGQNTGITSASYFEFGVRAGYSASAWLSSGITNTTPGGIISHGNNDWQLQQQIAANCAAPAAAGCYSWSEYSNGTYQNANEPAPLHDAGWHYVVGVRYTTSPYLVIYVDGVLKAGFTTNDNATTKGTNANVTYPLTLGAYPNSAALPPATIDYFAGSMVEATISKVSRDSNYVKLSYATQSPTQTAVTFASASTVPGAPTAVSGTVANAQSAVSWTAPSSNGGATITGYTVTSSPGSFTCTTTGGTTCTVNGLTNGTAYTFTVTATNSVGTGAASVASAPVTPVLPVGSPTAPASITAVTGNGRATLTWPAGTANGSAITGYIVTSAPDGKTCSTTTALTCVDSLLTNGTAYTFTVVATSTAGNSAASAVSNSVTPQGAPSAPVISTVTSGNAQVTVAWTAPASNGSAITGYTVTSAPGSFTCTTATLTCNVTGLTNGTAYTFTMVATNGIGNSTASAASAAVTPATVPGAPTTVTAKGGNTVDTVSWVAPTSTGGSAITGYTVSTAADTSKHCTTTGALTCVITGLTNTTSYSFTVVASNAVGKGAASVASTPATGIVFASKDLAMHITGSSMILNLPQVSGIANVSILDIWGRTVWSKTVSANAHEVSWAKAGIASGLYIARLTVQDANHKSRLAAESKILVTP